MKGGGGADTATLFVLLLLIAQVILFIMAFSVYYKIKDRRGPPGRGTCPYN